MKDNIVSNKEMRSRRLRRDIFGRRTDPVSLPDVKRHGLDYPLLIAVVLLCAFGLLMLFSASYYYAQSYKGDGLYYVRRQLVYMLAGIGIMIGLSYVPYTLYSKRIVNCIIYIALIILLVIVLAFGRTAQGAQRWIAIGPITIQPSEFTKFVLVIVLANYMARNRTYMKNFVSGLLVPGILTLLPCVLILLQPNLSMVIIIAIVFIVMVFLGGCNIDYHTVIDTVYDHYDEIAAMVRKTVGQGSSSPLFDSICPLVLSLFSDPDFIQIVQKGVNDVQ